MYTKRIERKSNTFYLSNTHNIVSALRNNHENGLRKATPLQPEPSQKQITPLTVAPSELGTR